MAYGGGGGIPPELLMYALMAEKSKKGKILKNLEALLPLILLGLLGFFALGALGIFDLGSFIPMFGKTKNVLVLGDPSRDLEIALKSADAKKMGIMMASYGNPNAVYPQTLSDYDVVILVQSGSDKGLTRSARQVLVDYVKKGGKLIVVQNSGVDVPESKAVVGWSYIMGDIMPVECEPFVFPDEKDPCHRPRTIRGQFVPVDPDHPIVKGIKVTPIKGTMTFRVYDVTPKGEIVAYIQTPDAKQVYPAIVVRSPLLGTVVYFNYDPGKIPDVLLNTIEWLA